MGWWCRCCCCRCRCCCCCRRRRRRRRCCFSLCCCCCCCCWRTPTGAMGCCCSLLVPGSFLWVAPCTGASPIEHRKVPVSVTSTSVLRIAGGVRQRCGKLCFLEHFERCCQNLVRFRNCSETFGCQPRQSQCSFACPRVSQEWRASARQRFDF